MDAPVLDKSVLGKPVLDKPGLGKAVIGNVSAPAPITTRVDMLRRRLHPVADQPAPLDRSSSPTAAGYWSLVLFGILFFGDAVRRVHRQRQADPRPLQGRTAVARRWSTIPRASSAASSPSPTTRTPSSSTRSSRTAGSLWPPIRYTYASINKDFPRLKSRTGQCLGFPAPPLVGDQSRSSARRHPTSWSATTRSAIATGSAPTTRAATCSPA